MFLNAERLDVQKMILAETIEAREAVLKELEPLVQAIPAPAGVAGQAGHRAAARPPLHEFLPTESGEIEQLAETTGLGLLGFSAGWRACARPTR